MTVIRMRRAHLEAMVLAQPEIGLECLRALVRRLDHTPQPEETPDVTPQLVGQLLLLLDPRQSTPTARTTLRELAAACEVDLNSAHLALGALFERELCI